MRFIFKKVLSDHDTSKIITYIEDSKNKEITLALEKNIAHLATKEDLAKLEIKISDTKSHIGTWMFMFWPGQIGVTVGMVLLF